MFQRNIFEACFHGKSDDNVTFAYPKTLYLPPSLELNRNFFQKILFAGGQTKNPLELLIKGCFVFFQFFFLVCFTPSILSLFPTLPVTFSFSTLHLKGCQALFALIIRTQSVQSQVHYKNSQRLGGLLIRHYVCGGVEMYTGLVAHQIDSPAP